jgi:DNA (cytosine-5)-methyltransferase 1
MGYFVNVLDLFSGIGGFSLGLERAGMRTVAFCEIDPFCRRVLAKHWPDVEISADVTQRGFVSGEADIITAGFPCQDISLAGEGAGLAGARSGLYRHVIRAIRLVRPKFAVLENVAALLARGMGTVVGDMAEVGYDAEWHCIPASAVGAPHRRDRVWIVGYPFPSGLEGYAGNGEIGAQLGRLISRQDGPVSPPGLRENVADAARELFDGAGTTGPGWRGQSTNRRWWSAEPDVGRVANGVRSRVDRLKALGNAVVPQIPEIIGRAIMSAVTSHERTKGE